MIDAVVFDFDGTLADTRDAVIVTVEQTLREFSVPVVDPDTIAGSMGLPLEHTFQVAGVRPELLAEAVRRYRERFPANSGHIALFPGVESVLHDLSAASMPITVASSRGRQSLLELLGRLNIRPLFSEVLGEQDVERKKPAPDLVFALSRALGVAPSRMLVVGDTTYDIVMGRAAGSHTCAVTYGSHDVARLRSADPTWLIDSFAELRAILTFANDSSSVVECLRGSDGGGEQEPRRGS